MGFAFDCHIVLSHEACRTVTDIALAAEVAEFLADCTAALAVVDREHLLLDYIDHAAHRSSLGFADHNDMTAYDRTVLSLSDIVPG